MSPRAEAVDGGDESGVGIRGPDEGARVGVLLETHRGVLGLAGFGLEDKDVFQRPASKRLVHVISDGLDLEVVCWSEVVGVVWRRVHVTVGLGRF